MRQFAMSTVLAIAVCGCARQPPPAYQSNVANEYLRAMTAPASAPTPLAPAAAPMSSNEIVEKTKPEMDAWSNCVFDRTAKYMQANESAAVTVRAAMTSCYKQENELRLSLSLNNRSGNSTNELMSIRRKIVYDALVQIVIDQRVNLIAARKLSHDWADCLLAAAIKNTTTERPASKILSATYAVCRPYEDAMRRQLATFNKNADSIVADRKRRVFPVLARFVDELKRVGRGAKKPDLAA